MNMVNLSLAPNSFAWKSLEECRVEMKARIMYKTVDILTPSRLCDLFKNLDEITDYNSVMMELKFGTRYLRKQEIRCH